MQVMAGHEQGEHLPSITRHKLTSSSILNAEVSAVRLCDTAETEQCC